MLFLYLEYPLSPDPESHQLKRHVLNNDPEIEEWCVCVCVCVCACARARACTHVHAVCVFVVGYQCKKKMEIAIQEIYLKNDSIWMDICGGPSLSQFLHLEGHLHEK